jgi:hypothetical protein
MPMRESNLHDAERAVAYLGLPRDQVVSLKLRPVMWDSNRKELWNAYVYDPEYTHALMGVRGRKLTDIGMGDRATLLTENNGQAMLIQHESGPEVILLAKLALATASVGLAKELFSFFKELLKSINDANEKKKKENENGDGSTSLGRYYMADGATFELRLRGDPKLLNGIAFPVVDAEAFDRFLQEGLERARRESEWQGFRQPD